MAPEKYIGALFSILVSASYGTPTAIAQGAPEVRTQMENARAPHPHMKEDVDGDLQAGEYIVISPNGSITRALCPYTCEMRGLPKEHCKAWPSVHNVNECYLQDTRIPSTAVEFSGPSASHSRAR